MLALSYAACASGNFDAVSEPPERNGTPSRRASAATVYSTIAGSGVPNVGAPVCMLIELANEPRMTGAPWRTSCTNVMPANDSARVCVATPALVDGAIAPARMNGVMMRGLVGLGVGLGRGRASCRPTPAATTR